jgi:hypothetical protein
MRTWTTTTTVGADPVAVGLHPRGGLLGRVLAEATAGLLAAGLGPPASPAVPRHAVSRMASEALPC